MTRKLETRIRRLEEILAARLRAQARQSDGRLLQWLRTTSEAPLVAIYPDEDEEGRGIQSTIWARVHEHASSGQVKIEPPPEFRPNWDPQDRQVAWLVASDPELAELLERSDLAERITAAIG